ncbi:cupredoxin family copper-binding protein [Alisedimentitalea sp. MJ-SS2]|uniref:cupredoxin domain-containing protein n=1 Tax=Aliisedimentitalea sp. MJ-SS2 TaxID=3049795 RepID=UPI00290C1F6B|nr:cupredoxin family copper-binding protein [Alisedimentitalea sp. MJ-SS2]MDU8929166.1 cupredoxin family copper-binding protein [Alisedimentitalea sp. MJ-SS2]
MKPISRRTATAFFATAPLALATPAHAATHTVTIRRNKFKPAKITIKPGDTVTWKNEDGLEHTATARDKSWSTKSLSGGASGSIRFAEKGTFKYFCKWHPGMKGTVSVT